MLLQPDQVGPSSYTCGGGTVACVRYDGDWDAGTLLRALESAITAPRT